MERQQIFVTWRLRVTRVGSVDSLRGLFRCHRAFAHDHAGDARLTLLALLVLALLQLLGVTLLGSGSEQRLLWGSTARSALLLLWGSNARSCTAKAS